MEIELTHKRIDMCVNIDFHSKLKCGSEVSETSVNLELDYTKAMEGIDNRSFKEHQILYEASM